ncbi:MAG: ATP--guanido phosphotransferase [Clostridia bacterium]|nr:ATP--guanido phosphotransferase [Clostridia bacterium]
MTENIALSTRIRLARNFKGYKFIPQIDKEDAIKITKKVKDALFSSNEKSPLMFRQINQEELKINGKKLVEEHLISPDILNSKVESAVIIDNNKEISIMVNEEDHLRIQVIKKGFDLSLAYSLANACDDLIEEGNEYAFSEKFGYLTSCPTNVGTGLRASVMIHIPAICMSGRLNTFIRNVNRLGMTLRGYYGEGTKSLGNIFQVSNEVTLGISEEEIILRLKNIVSEIIKEEIKLREAINSDSLADKVLRSFGILKYCHMIGYKEFSSLWSDVLLGADMGIIDNIDCDLFKKLISSLAPYSIGEEDTLKRDKLRAKLIKEVI